MYYAYSSEEVLRFILVGLGSAFILRFTKPIDHAVPIFKPNCYVKFTCQSCIIESLRSFLDDATLQ
jgi:hypothetical protein